MFYPGFDFEEEFKQNWNRKVKRMRWICLLLGLLMIGVGVACIFFPIQAFDVVKTIAAVIIIGFGVYSIINFCLTSSYFKEPIHVITGIINILFGILLLQTPSEITAMSLTIMFAIMLMFYGAEKIAFARRFSFFGMINTGSYTFSGVLTILLAIIFLILPWTSAILINYIIAAYLIIDGVTLLIEAINMKKIR
ncbi:HdeD family acid-resistance protein [Traorella massiliensis]|uniref:HdeD family acid-resistance protein n=1 Tax=Traorella massiliensis TaxID=1903263 RepID=UPI002354F9C0|nr:DUF308 domain-containing protein [Traorella massiliensis]